ncbi:hypothetical protein QF031_001472 [Pseudarthrobacter defluvii]|uniref:sunset domain-containing protein n=1 Tax=Pseudarthrobacter defluvii TaxID=410837 RepID=UPI002785092C|nr:hypothetical protein [Pseudarthrobacter defluvii]MDQ0768723.1 hypothetical protein [Pseudarthrobacter defluvii]
MDIVFWIILLVVIAVIIWWLLNRNKSANPPDGSSAGTVKGGTRADGALEGGSAAASAQAAGTTGIPTAAGFGRPAEPAAPATAEEPADSSATSTRESPAGGAGLTDQAAAGRDTPAGSAERDDRRRPGQAVDQAPDRAADQAADQAEWETQWSEAGAARRSGSSATSGAGTPPLTSPGTASQETSAHRGAKAEASAAQASPSTSRAVHHDEYTAPHAPTLPGAETAAMENADDGGAPVAGQAGGQAPQHRADTFRSGGAQAPAAESGPATTQGGGDAAETLERAQSSALVENGATHHQPSGRSPESNQGQGFSQGQDVPQGQGSAVPEPAGHLAAQEPYGAGSAASGPDGSGPEDYTVKGDAAAMVYYEEGHPDYEQTKAEVWFESAAHAEAAGFRAPRRKRL